LATTAATLLPWPTQSNTAHLFPSGDTRIYRVTGERLEQLTEDHRHLLSGRQHYLSRALGFHDALEMDYSRIPVDIGDTFVLTTDGVYEFLAPETIAGSIAQASDLDAAARELVESAYSAGSDDNLTIQIIRLEDLP
jgi:serine/threonine protein phosphatase PrpC